MQFSNGIVVIARMAYPHAIGGAEIHTFCVARELAKQSKVLLISGHNGRSSVQFQGCFVHLTAGIPAIPFFSSVFFTLYALTLLILKAKRVGILHAQVALSPAVIGILAKTVLNVPFVITCHGSEVRLQKNSLIKIIQRIAFAIADQITVVSNEIKHTLVSQYHVNPSKIDVIPNGFDPALCRDSSNTPKHGNSNVVCVGRLSYPKDPLTVLCAFRQVHKVIPNTRLYFIGDGQLRPLLEQFCISQELLSHVCFLGELPHNRALRVTAESTVFILSSFEEGLPTSLIEAMALKKPVIAAAVGGIPEVVKDGINGILVPPKSPTHLAKALERLLNDQELQRRLGKKAAESVKDHTWSEIAKKYERVYVATSLLRGNQ